MLKDDVKEWTNGGEVESWTRFKQFVKNSTAVYDCAECNIRLIQYLVSGHKSEDSRK